MVKQPVERFSITPVNVSLSVVEGHLPILGGVLCKTWWPLEVSSSSYGNPPGLPWAALEGNALLRPCVYMVQAVY